MKITPLAPTGDAYKVLYQDEKTNEGFIIGISGTLSAVWSLKIDEEKLEILNQIARKLVDAHGFKALHEKEKVYTTNDTHLDLEQAIREMVWNLPN